MKVRVLGCMAERLKKFGEREKIVDMSSGTRCLQGYSNLLKGFEKGHDTINVILSKGRLYGDIQPVRLSSNGCICPLYRLLVVVIICVHFCICSLTHWS